MNRFGEMAEAAMPVLAEWIGGDDDVARLASAVAKIDRSKISMVMPVLLEALESDINVDRLTGVETLRELGKISRDRDRQP